MIRLALKNLWSQRRVYGWLMLELVILSILAWIIIDPTIVRIFYANQPVGYDADRLGVITISSYPSSSSKYSVEAADSATVSENFDRVYSVVESWPGIESATIVSKELEGMGIDSYDIPSATDTVTATAFYYLVGTPFFSTYGIKPVDGKTMEELQKTELSSGGIVVSEAVAKGFGKKPREAIGLQVWDGRWHIEAVTNNVLPKSLSPQNTVVILPFRKANLGTEYMGRINSDQFTIVFRVKDGIDPARFIDENRQALKEKLAIGNYNLSTIESFAKKSAYLRDTMGYTKANRIGIFMAVFYLVNMALGVIGTVWLQTRRRSSEAGVMKAFGARAKHIISTLTWEGVILTTLAWLIGSFIYLQYAIKSGLAQAEYIWENNYPSSWVTDFWTHFGIVALIILALMLVAVVIGIWIPARRIARVDPALSLKDE